MTYTRNIREQFDAYTLRGVDPYSDGELLREWVSKDRFHAGVLSADFFLGTWDSRPACYAMEDAGGTIFFIRISRAARIYMQFSPVADLEQRQRISHALLKGMAFLEVGLARAGCEQWVFDTQSPSLRHLAERKMGFARASDDLIRPITPIEAEPKQEEASEGQEEGA